jgi:gluconolactonase
MRGGEFSIERLTEGLGHPEGPDLLADGRVVFVNTFASEVAVWEPQRGRSTYAYTGGAPAACAVGVDECVYVTQTPTIGGWTPADPRPASIQRIRPDGTLETLCAEIGGRAFDGLNDIVFGADGRLYFTDSGHWDAEERPDPGRVFAVDASGEGELIVELDHVYPNGIVADPDGSIVWAESYTRRIWRRRPNGEREHLCTLPEGHTPDGFKRDTHGNYWVATVHAGGLDVIRPDGTVAAFVAAGVSPLNCVFHGRQLYVTDDGPPGVAPTTGGCLLRLDAGVHGMPMFRGSRDHGFVPRESAVAHSASGAVSQ